MKKSRAVVFSAAVAGGILLAPAAAGAAPFLCPIIGEGAINADAHNGDHGIEVINPPAGTSQLPGNNQAGEHANSNAHNTENPSNPDAGPGGNSDFTPIWPG